MACAGGHLEVVNLLIDHDRFVCKDAQTALMNACKTGKVEIVKILIREGAVTRETLRSQDTDGNTCLMLACAGGMVDVFSVLIDEISNISSRRRSISSTEVLQRIARASSEDQGMSFLGQLQSPPSPQHRILASHSLSFDALETQELLGIANKEGNTAVTLLAHYYRDHDDKIGDFLQRAINENENRPYLLDMVS
jgi:ankyrin repeat protein